MSNEKRYWLMKSEPEECSIQDLKRDKTTWWTGVRNYQARNFMAQQMKVGDAVLFYHSNAEPSGIAGLATVSKPAEPDPLQFDSKSDYYDPKATKQKPIWECVQVKFVEAFPDVLALSEIRQNPKLKSMLLLRKGQRLSIQPVTAAEYNEILKMARR